MSEADVWVGTYTGKKFRPFAPRWEDVDIEDIAHSLSHQCRFNGHSDEFYSVAEHSIAVSHRVPAEDAMWGLLHDAAEAYVSDVVRPIKSRMAFLRGDGAIDMFRVVETNILRVIAAAFDLPWPMPASVEIADLRMLATERRNLFDGRQPAWDELATIEPYNKECCIELNCWPPFIAKSYFLNRYKALRGQPCGTSPT